MFYTGIFVQACMHVAKSCRLMIANCVANYNYIMHPSEDS